ncbi:protein kinase domain-containing protein [Gimesia sp.]|uniref:protein kinase domain-containing protein n=1 Tax=Gimesia sp. TaxID=2024833 RepID=UPI003A8E741F
MTMTLEQFVTQLDESGVLSPEEFALFQELHGADITTAEDLGKQLVKHKKITKLQAQMVYQGQGNKLRFGNYVIQEKIGSGGMGDVYLAKHRRMFRTVALKLLPTEMAKDQNTIRRFQREVQAAAKLSHANIVTAHDADEVEGMHYLVMEYVEGTDLSELVKQQGVLSVGQALDYILQAAKGLEYAHQEGIIHRDIKPSNMLLDKNGTIKILDMGLARIDEIDEENPATALTQSGSVMGTVDYMSPEQAQSTHTADNRSDIYSLGCTLYFLLTGNSVYGGKTVVNRILAHRDQPIPSLVSTNVHVPANVDGIYQKMIAKQPEDRFQSMQEVIDAIEKCDVLNPSSTMSADPPDPELQKFLQSQKIASSPTIVMPAGEISTDTQESNLTSDFMNQSLNGTTFEPLQRRKKSTGKRGWLISGLVLGSLVLMAGFVFKGAPSAGSVILDVDQTDITGAVVSVDGEQKLTIQTGKDQPPILVAADEQQHTLTVTKQGFEPFTRQFTVKSGQSETVKVHLVPVAVATVEEPAPMPLTMTEREILEWVFSQGGKVSVNSPLNHVSRMEELPDEPVSFYNIDLSNTAIVPQELSLLRGLSNLTTLKLDYTQIQDQDLQYLKNLKDLGFLHLNHTSITGEGLKYLKELPVLNAISLEDTKLTDAGLRELIRHKPLRLLYVTNTDITNDGMKTIGEMENLTKLKFSNNRQLNDTGMAYLASLTKLESLYAHLNRNITDEGIKHLQGLNSLYEITLATTGITDEGLQYLVGLENLGKLDLVNCKITDVGLKYLYNMKTLRNLKLSQTKVTPEGIAALKQALPKCEIESDFKAEMQNSMPRSEREIAEWVIGLGGSVAVNGMSCKQITDLPDETFEITAVALRGLSFEDHQLASLANLKKLTGLYLDTASISDSTLAHLGKLQQLQKLCLKETKITGAVLSNLGEIPGLTYLDVAGSALTNVGLKNIANLKQLVTLNISHIAGIDDTGLAHIAGMTKLQELYLHNNPQLTDEGIKHIREMQLLTELTLDNTTISDTGMQYLAGMKDLEKLGLANCQRLSDASFVHLVNLKNLKSLQLFLTPITDAGLKHLHGLKKLELLDLRDTKVTRGGITALQQALPNCKIESNFKAAMLNGSPKTGREIAEWIIRIGGRVAVNRISCKQLAEIPEGTVVIDAINLREKNLKDPALAPLANLKKLEVLYLDSNPITDTTLQYFSELPLLTTLSLPKTKMTGDGLKYLAGLSKLVTLDLEGSAITNNGLKDSGQLQSLLSLNIAVNPEIDDAGLAHLAALTGLKKLFAHRNPDITDEGLKHLQGMKELELLSLGSTGITDVGLKQIAEFEKLKRLEIYNTRITDTGLEKLAKLKDLNLLALQLTSITDDGLKHLHGLEKLESLDLSQTKVTPDGIASLRQALPNCQIKSDFAKK